MAGSIPILNDAARQFARFVSRPVIAMANYAGLDVSEYHTYLESVGPNYYSAPIYLEAGCQVQGFQGHAIPWVASASMCAQPSGAGGNTGMFSPTALLCDRYYDLVVTAGSSLNLTSISPTGSLTVASLDRAIPKGFALSFGANYVKVTADAALHATTLQLARIYDDVHITSGDLGQNINGFFSQGGVPSPHIRDLNLVGDNTPIVDVNHWTGLKYACDGLAFEAAGAVVENCRASNFAGHGFYASYPLVNHTSFGITAPWDAEKITLNNLLAFNCLSGITIAATDVQTNQLVARDCRDYGVHFIGSAAQNGSIHTFGCGTGIKNDLDCQGNLYYGDTCGIGWDVGGAINQLNSYRGFNNTYAALRINGGTTISNVFIQHFSELVNGSDSLPTGYAIVVSPYAAHTSLGGMVIDCHKRDSATTAASGMWLRNGLTDFSNQSTYNMRANGIIQQVSNAGTTYGVRVSNHMANCHWSLAITGFTNDLYFDTTDPASRPLSLTGNKLDFFGATDGTIHWPVAGPNSSLTGTFSAPNIPTSIAANNSIAFHTY